MNKMKQIPTSTKRWALRLAALFALAGGVMSTSTASAQCVPINSVTPPAGDAALFAIEGKITAFDRTARTVTANGVTIALPAGLLVSTANLDGPPNLTFEQLTDPAQQATRSIIGATVIAEGNITNSVTAGVNCISFVATAAFFEMAENVLLGVLHNIDTQAGTFKVNGQTVRMNTDPRFPSALLDLGGKPIALASLIGFEGTAVSVEGWMENGVFNAVLAETEAITRAPGVDAVAISRAQRRANELRVDGSVAPNAAGALATSVTVFAGEANATFTACQSTTPLGTAAVAVDRTFSFRLRRDVNTASVCVKSTLGGVTDHATVLK